MHYMPRLAALATAVPPFRLRQADIARRAHRVFEGHSSAIERLMPVFDNAGIGGRYSCVPLDWYERDHDWPERSALYIENAVALLERAARDCLARAACPIEAVDAIVTVSTTGIATPSLDALLLERLAFRRDVERLPIFGLGCAGGVLGLSRAAALARADPGTHVLLLVVELCALTFRRADRSKSNIVAAALFGDGAAAALIGPAAGIAADRPAIVATGEHTWPGSLDVMGWRVEEDGLGVLFSRDIPALVRDEFRGALDRFLAENGRRLEDIDRFVCHPGGAKVIAAIESALDLPQGTLNAAREVLHDYGNMSAATVMFVLERAMHHPARRYLMSALGPGFTVGFALLEAPTL
ncbi:MAG TPA: 3-oxoacyl-[acyl-carrier-protein] synthase III C-terminal domain-containing protein [Alphaproteobacteria bacterium]|nr:3-oxoacyl-[acyl-carrier-protein] synthase III C-terminal domain-containing protein [Alphaproteobacteria bacterium]